MTTTLLSHDDLLRWRICARRFWLHRQQDEPCDAQAAASDTAEAIEALVVHGPAADQVLRASFPRAVVIDAPTTPAEWAQAIDRTEALIAEGFLDGFSGQGEGEGRAILGACLSSNDGALVRIDVLAAGHHGLRLLKVRYATVGDEADVDAVALWAHVVARCGLRVQSMGLLLVDTDFIYPGHGCYAGLLREVDLAPVLGSRSVPSWLVAMRACERGPEPGVQPDAHCTQHGRCEFTAHCNAQPSQGRSTDPANLEIVGRELAAELRLEGHADLLSVAEARLPDTRRRRALRGIQNGAPELDPAVAGVIQALPHSPYPRYFLRFDTIGFATPIWAGTRPYQVLPFQWSCDVEAAPGELLRHTFLAGKDGDPRREFAQTLLNALGQSGPVFAYNAGFERNRIRELALLFDDLSAELDAVQARIVDLFQIARAHYYHPAMCGSWSFKSVCRAMAPELQADHFDWSGETLPPAAFAVSVQGGLNSAALSDLRKALMSHGQRQTAALRRMVALFEGDAAATPEQALKLGHQERAPVSGLANAAAYLALFAQYGHDFGERDFGDAYLAPEDERYRLLFDQVCHLLVQASAFNMAMPQEFRRTARLYLDGDAATLAHMRIAEMRHFMLSDVYDYMHLSDRMGQGHW